MPDPLLTMLVQLVLSRFWGKYRGLVVDNADPAGRGRIKVKIPAVLGEETVWALPCVPYAGDGVGFLALPEPDTLVWVEFEAGDISHPIWAGCFWGDGELPGDGSAARKLLFTAQTKLTLDDDAKAMTAESLDGGVVTITDSVIAEAGGASVEVSSSGVVADSGGSGKVEVAAAKVSVNSGALEVT